VGTLREENQPITFFGDGSQTRSFCYVDHKIEGLVLLVNGGDNFTVPVNLANPVEFSVLALAADIDSRPENRRR
jgi:nucleoside-diphosphate-sugar epimerase